MRNDVLSHLSMDDVICFRCVISQINELKNKKMSFFLSLLGILGWFEIAKQYLLLQNSVKPFSFLESSRLEKIYSMLLWVVQSCLSMHYVTFMIQKINAVIKLGLGEEQGLNEKPVR